ncbi:MAG TPA: Ig-like domain-containing protein, partial [Spirochaetia bacterium]|nr:Ig-like domain-containing protein [Spirochaetia bacterium]
AEKIQPASIVGFTANPTSGAVQLRVTDKAGNASTVNVAQAVNKDIQPYIPEAREVIKANNIAFEGGPGIILTGSDTIGPISWSAPLFTNDTSAFPKELDRVVRFTGAANFSVKVSGLGLNPKKPEIFYGFSKDSITTAIPLKASKTAGEFEGTIKLPSQADGRITLWFRALDQDGLEYITRCEIEYDSTPPQLTLVSPGTSANQTFTVAVQADDLFGIAKLSYKIGTESGDFELTPGGTIGVKTVSFPAKTTNLDVVITAIDGSGNRAVQTYKVALDPASLVPDIRLLTQFDGITLTQDMPVMVYAVSNAGIRSVSIGLDAAAFGAEGEGPLFIINPGAIPPGRRTLSAVAVDSLGNSSKKLQATFIRAGDEISIACNAVKTKNVPTQFVQGMPIVLAEGTTLELSVASAIPLKVFEYRFNSGEWIKATLPSKPSADGSLALSIPLTVKLPYGRVLVETRAEDTAGLVTIRNTVFYRVAPEQTQGVEDKEQIYLIDGRFSESNVLLCKPGDTIRAYFNGRPIKSAVLSPQVPYLTVNFEGNIITITADGEGIGPETKLVVTTVDNEKYETPVFTIISDAEAPQIALNGSEAPRWVKDRVQILGTVKDANGIKILEYSMDYGETWQTTPLSTKAGTESPINATVSFPGLVDGGYQIWIRATDNAGRTSLALLPIVKDTNPPTVITVLPKNNEEVNGFILHVLEIQDAGDIAKVEYSIDGKNWDIIEQDKWYPRGYLEPLPAGKGAEIPPFAGYIILERMLDLGLLKAGPELLAYRITDKAGNQTVYYPLAKDNPSFIVNIDADKPIVQVSIPGEMEVMRNDFVVSGIAYDDDGVASIAWRIDGSDWQTIENANSFSVPFKLLEIADNEHTFESYAVDINGVKGEIAKRVFRVSRAEPVGELIEPYNETVRGVIVLKGTASDANGIKEVWVSFDNGNTYNKAIGTTSWTYSLDTRILKDGVHSIYVRILDNYDTPGFAAGLVSIDNTLPIVSLDTPFDGSELFGSFILGGRVSDNIALKNLVMEISPIGSATGTIKAELPLNTVFSKAVDISKLAPGWYNLRVTATDFANNESYVARNFMVLSGQKAESIDIIFPVHGEKVSGSFAISGKVTSNKQYKRAVIYLNNEPYSTVDINKEGYFNLPLKQEELSDGSLSIRVETSAEEGTVIKSETRTILYEQNGPWLTIDSISTGDFITGRPYVTGTCGWDTPVADKTDKQAWALYQQQLKERTPIKVEYSFDNGRTFMEAKGVPAYKFRLETQDYVNGELRILIRATFANGDYAVRKVNVTIDTKKPAVTVIAPEENVRLNQKVSVVGTAFDENGLKEVGVLIRTGDKAAYSVPGFIQGSYFDAHVLGATRYETGLGLSFFDDNVKLQFALGQGFDARPTWDNIFGMITENTPPADISRFGGYVLGLKLLANIAYLPFGYYFGPDWDFFSMSFTMGANFTYFSMQKDIANIFSPPEGRYIILSSILGQWEFAKITFKDWVVLKSYALYVEGSLVFIPSEASTRLEELVRPNIAFGLRIGLF